MPRATFQGGAGAFLGPGPAELIVEGAVERAGLEIGSTVKREGRKEGKER
jgi:hypothetical protein